MHFQLGRFVPREGVFKGSFRYGSGDYETAIELLRSGKVEVESVITHKYAFEAAEDAFTAVSQQVGFISTICGLGLPRDFERVSCN